MPAREPALHQIRADLPRPSIRTVQAAGAFTCGVQVRNHPFIVERNARARRGLGLKGLIDHLQSGVDTYASALVMGDQHRSGSVERRGPERVQRSRTFEAAAELSK